MRNSKSIFSKAFLAITAAAVLSFAACKEEADDHLPANTAVITITSPAENDTISVGDTLSIEGTAIGEEELHGYDLYILKKTSGDTVFTADDHAHNDTVDIHHHWEGVDTTATGALELNIIFTVDHDNNTQTEKVNFHCVP